ncbi:hypothetical protein B566_EDAN010315, partial [Ephemera danica]
SFKHATSSLCAANILKQGTGGDKQAEVLPTQSRLEDKEEEGLQCVALTRPIPQRSRLATSGCATRTPHPESSSDFWFTMRNSDCKVGVGTRGNEHLEAVMVAWHSIGQLENKCICQRQVFLPDGPPCTVVGRFVCAFVKSASAEGKMSRELMTDGPRNYLQFGSHRRTETFRNNGNHQDVVIRRPQPLQGPPVKSKACIVM